MEQVRSFISAQGGYAKAGTLRAERSELVDLQKAVPGGVFCLGTALSVHRIGTWEPPEFQLAIRSDSRIGLPTSSDSGTPWASTSRWKPCGSTYSRLLSRIRWRFLAPEKRRAYDTRPLLWL